MCSAIAVGSVSAAARSGRPVGIASSRVGVDHDVAAERAAEVEVVGWRPAQAHRRPAPLARAAFAATRRRARDDVRADERGVDPGRRPRRPCPPTRGRAPIRAARTARARGAGRCRRSRSATPRRARRRFRARARSASAPRSDRRPCRPPPASPRTSGHPYEVRSAGVRLRHRVSSLSVVVVAHDMARELPRTLATLAPPLPADIEAGRLRGHRRRQRLAGADRRGGARRRCAGRCECIRLDPAPPSPARAANVGHRGGRRAISSGSIVDGARMASPGLLATAGARGPARTSLCDHEPGVPPGHRFVTWRRSRPATTSAAEDELLAASGWEHDGYQLFAHQHARRARRAGAGSDRWGRAARCSWPRPLWDELGGLDERFDLPGGGLVNHDLYRRACALDGVQLVVLLGEGTFHQFHGGAATTRRYTLGRDARAVRGDSRMRLRTARERAALRRVAACRGARASRSVGAVGRAPRRARAPARSNATGARSLCRCGVPHCRPPRLGPRDRAVAPHAADDPCATGGSP